MSEPTYEIESLVFETEPYQEYTVNAFCLKFPHQADALVNLFKGGKKVRSFTFPVYKIWNVFAHYREIVDSEINGNNQGVEAAAWNGISGAIFLVP